MRKIIFLIYFLCIQSQLVFANPIMALVQDMSFGMLYQGESKYVTVPDGCAVSIPEVGIVSITGVDTALTGTVTVLFPSYLYDSTGNNSMPLIATKAAFCQAVNSTIVVFNNSTTIDLEVSKNKSTTSKNRIYTFGAITVPNAQAVGDYSGIITIEFLY